MRDENLRLEVLFDENRIDSRNRELARQIAETMGRDILVVAILKGSFVFTADLIRALYHAGCRPRVDFMTLSSYGKGTESSGNAKVLRDLSESVEGEKVLLVDDILESGRTMAFARDLLRSRGAEDVRICILLDKPGKRVVDVDADFTGFECPDKFVVGYGLDYAHYYRELPFIGHLVSED